MRKHILSACIVLAVIGGESRGDLLAGTPVAAPYAGRVAVGEYGFGAEYPIQQARPFSTGATACYLDSILLGTHFYWESGAGGMAVSLYSDNGGMPGTVVAGGQDLFTATAANIDQMLLPGSALTLAANSTYWFVASVDQSQGTTRCWWELTDSALFDSDVPGNALPLTRANDAPDWTPYPDSSMQMSIYGTVVPEPGTLSLLGLAGLGSYLLRRGRFKRSRSIVGDTFALGAYETPFLAGERASRRTDSARQRQWRKQIWIPLDFEAEERG